MRRYTYRTYKVTIINKKDWEDNIIYYYLTKLSKKEINVTHVELLRIEDETSHVV